MTFHADKEFHRKLLDSPNVVIEIRCVRLEGMKNSHEVTWPDFGELWINNSKVFDFKPLQINSALKKRKDEKFYFNSEYL